MKVYYDKDADLSLIKGKTVAIIGYGSQGHAHAQNLNDSGVKVVVGLRKGGASWPKVEKAGLKVAEVADAVKSADVVMILLPDEQIASVYLSDVEPNIREGASLVFVVSATDADGQPLFFRASGLPSGSTFRDLYDNTASFSWTPGYTQAGSYGPTFIVDDTFGGVDAKAVSITVTNVNQAPVLDPIGDRSVERGTSLSIFVTGADPDGDAVSFTSMAQRSAPVSSTRSISCPSLVRKK